MSLPEESEVTEVPGVLDILKVLKPLGLLETARVFEGAGALEVVSTVVATGENRNLH